MTYIYEILYALFLLSYSFVLPWFVVYGLLYSINDIKNIFARITAHILFCVLFAAWLFYSARAKSIVGNGYGDLIIAPFFSFIIYPFAAYEGLHINTTAPIIVPVTKKIEEVKKNKVIVPNPTIVPVPKIRVKKVEIEGYYVLKCPNCGAVINTKNLCCIFCNTQIMKG